MAKAKEVKQPETKKEVKKTEKKEVKEPVKLDINNSKHGNLTDAERNKL